MSKKAKNLDWDKQRPGESFEAWEKRVNPEWTKKDFKRAKPGHEVFKELGLKPPKPRGRPAMSESERKKRVTIMLDKDVIEYFKKDGKGWQTRANAALRKAAGL